MIAKSVDEGSVQNSVDQSNGVTIVADLVRSTLNGSGYAALSDVTCEFESGVLVLTGRVPSFYMKQMAQTLVRQLEPISHIDNRLEVS